MHPPEHPFFKVDGFFPKVSEGQHGLSETFGMLINL